MMHSGDNTAVTAVTKTDLVADRVIQSIASGQYKPGDKLPAENYYVQSCGVSRVTVREAFKKLNSMGVVSICQGYGTFVCKIKPFKINDVLLPLLTGSRQMTDDLYEARIFIEQAILELALKRKTPDAVSALQDILKDMEGAVSNSDLNKYSAMDFAFHDALTSMCGNSVLESIYDSLSNIRRNNITKSNVSIDSIKKSIDDHRQILQAIIDNDTDKAKGIMEAHLLYSRQMAYQGSD